MDKAFFIDHFSKLSNEELLEIIKDKANRQREAVDVATELLTKRGLNLEKEAFSSQYNKEINQTPKEIKTLKIVRLFCLLLFNLFWATIWHLTNSSNEKANPRSSHDHATFVFITVGVSISLIIAAYFNSRIAKLKNENEARNLIDSFDD